MAGAGNFARRVSFSIENSARISSGVPRARATLYAKCISGDGKLHERRRISTRAPGLGRRTKKIASKFLRDGRKDADAGVLIIDPQRTILFSIVTLLDESSLIPVIQQVLRRTAARKPPDAYAGDFFTPRRITPLSMNTQSAAITSAELLCALRGLSPARQALASKPSMANTMK